MSSTPRRDSISGFVNQDGDTTGHWIHGERITEEDCRDREDRLLGQCFAVANSGYWLDDADRARLSLAGLGDIKRLFEWVGDERRRFEEAGTDGVIGARPARIMVRPG